MWTNILGFAPANTTSEQVSEWDAIIKIIEIIKLCVQLAIEGTRKVNEKLELSFLAFMAMLRSNILVDPRTIWKLKVNDELADACNDKYTRIIDKLTSEDILGIIEIFLKKMILNFVNGSSTLVEENLEMFKIFVNSQGTHRYLLKLDTTQDLISNHYTKYVVLDKENMLEYLSGFYKILTIFWEVNENTEVFWKYMKPWVNYLQSLTAHNLSPQTIDKGAVLRILYILNGVAQGFTTSESYNQFFDWLFPDNFKIVTEIFKNCWEDRKILKGLFKLMAELLDNKTRRLKPDQSSITGFILFKEISSILIEYFKFIQMYQDAKIKSDRFDEKYQFIETAVEIFENIVSGNYINFSVCSYYNDNTFIEFSKIIFTLITLQDPKELASFTRLSQLTYSMIENFMKHHSELMMNNYEPELIVKIIETTLSGLITENESKGSCCNALKDFCTTIYLSRDKLSDKIKNLLNKENAIFRIILKTLLTTVIYEEHKIIWVFQKPLFPTIIINGKEDFEVVKSEIIMAESNPELAEKIKTELESLWENVELILDKYNKEAFNSNFTKFKNSLIKFK